MRTLCLPITKDTLWLQGLTKLDQLVSRMTYSPFRAQNRTDEWSNGCPAYCRTADKNTVRSIDTQVKLFFECNSDASLFLWMASIMGRSLGCRCRRTGVPIKSWGRYPSSGTALTNTVFNTCILFYSTHIGKIFSKALPLINILKNTTRRVCGGEDALVCGNPRCLNNERKEINHKLGLNFTTQMIPKDSISITWLYHHNQSELFQPEGGSRTDLQHAPGLGLSLGRGSSETDSIAGPLHTPSHHWKTSLRLQ